MGRIGKAWSERYKGRRRWKIVKKKNEADFWLIKPQ